MFFLQNMGALGVTLDVWCTTRGTLWRQEGEVCIESQCIDSDPEKMDIDVHFFRQRWHKVIKKWGQRVYQSGQKSNKKVTINGSAFTKKPLQSIEKLWFWHILTYYGSSDDDYKPKKAKF